MNDVQEIENIRSELKNLRNDINKGIVNWQKTNPRCDYEYGLVAEICKSPGKINTLVFDPMEKWLADYILTREGKLAFTGPGSLDGFLKIGLRTIHNFVTIADFFSRNPQYLVSGTDKQKLYVKLLDTISSNLIGCNEKLAFIFLKLSKTIKVLPEDLLKIQSDLETKCNTYRIRGLKL